MDIENLFGRGISFDDLKDYNMARALDKIAERGAHEVFSTLCLEAISSEQLSLKYLHSDTTSISVHGDYEYAEATVHIYSSPLATARLNGLT
jgi:transposase